MGSAYSYMDKEARRKLSHMPLMTAGVFNRHFNTYRDKIALSLTNEEEADNLRLRFSDYFSVRIQMMSDIVGIKTGWRRRPFICDSMGDACKDSYYTPFGEELVNDYVALLQLVIRSIRKEKKKEEIKAAAEGKIGYEDLKRKFPMIATETLGRNKIKVHLYRDLCDDGRPQLDPVKRSCFIWHHWEAIEKKDWYSVEEITACIRKIIDHTMAYYMEHVKKINVANAVLKKIGNIEL